MSQQMTFIDQYRDHIARVGKSAHTVKAYNRDVGAFALWWVRNTGQEFSPQVVDPRDIREYRGYLMRQRRAPATINRKLIALRRFFHWAKREGMAVDNPFEVLESVLVKQQKDTAPRWLDRREQLALLRAVRKKGHTRDLAIIQTLLGTGLRISELAALKVSNLEISERKGWLYVWEGKGGKARDIPLDKATRQDLANYLKERQLALSAGTKKDTERLFLGQRGPLSEKGIDYLVGKYVYQAQLEHCTCHTLRHTFAKNLVDVGTPLDQVATLLGHESLDTTRVYTRPSKRDLERAVRRAAGEV
jgi:site-specific recombinase XerD